MTGTFIGCWIGAGLFAVHALVGRFRYQHWPALTRLSGSFLAGLGTTSTVWALTPILSDPKTASVSMTSEIITSLWLGLLAVIVVGGVAVRDNFVALQQDGAKAFEAKRAVGEKQA